MSSRSGLRARVRDNLDDTQSANYKWSIPRLNRVMEQERRIAFSQMETLRPGDWIHETAEDLSIVSGTQEYDLQTGVAAIRRVERIARDGTALDQPVPLDRVNYTDRHEYETTTTSDGAHFYYLYRKLVGGIPFLTIGFVPTPKTTGADIRVHELFEPWELSDNTWDPDAAGSAGTADDGQESGLPARWEDLVVVRSTIAALLQRPPAAGSPTIQQWRQEEARILAILDKRESEEPYQDAPREVRFVDEPEAFG